MMCQDWLEMLLSVILYAATFSFFSKYWSLESYVNFTIRNLNRMWLTVGQRPFVCLWQKFFIKTEGCMWLGGLTGKHPHALIAERNLASKIWFKSAIVLFLIEKKWVCCHDCVPREEPCMRNQQQSRYRPEITGIHGFPVGTWYSLFYPLLFFG